MNRIDVDQRTNLVLIAPVEKIPDRPTISFTGVGVSDGGGEELQKALCSLFTFVGDQSREIERQVAELDFAGFGLAKASRT